MASKVAEEKFWNAMEKFAVDDDCLGYLLDALTDEELIRATEKIQKEEEAAEKEEPSGPVQRIGLTRGSDLFKGLGGQDGQ